MQYLIKITFSITFLFSLVSSNLSASATQIFEDNVEGVVMVMTEKGLGSGTIISETGYLLTNWHVIENSSDISVCVYGFPSFEECVFEVIVIRADPLKDLALLKILNPPKKLQPIKISIIVSKTGSKVHAIGHPDGEIWSHTQGYISQQRNDFLWNYDNEKGREFKFESDVYQMQTPMHSGNSGGPLLNDHGNLIGINTFGIIDTAFINYAITAEEILRFLIRR
ncbi:MAG: S1C family serine protease [Gammaproteobacteria bacterium]